MSRHIAKVVERLDPARYRQEPAYVAALFGRLDAVVYRGSDLILELKSTVVEDHGPNTAESIWGADFGIVASIHSKTEEVEKAVIGQAKRGFLPNLPPREAEAFRKQVVKMSNATKAIIGLEVPEVTGVPPMVRVVDVPTMFGQVPVSTNPYLDFDYTLFPSSSGDLRVYMGKALPLGQYLYAQLLRCLHGDTNERLIRGLDSSSLDSLRIEARS